MEALKKPEIFCSTRLSKVELHALATLAVPVKRSQELILTMVLYILTWFKMN